MTISRIYIEPNAAEPTKDSTKFFTPRMDPGLEGRARDGPSRKASRTEVRAEKSFNLKNSECGIEWGLV